MTPLRSAFPTDTHGQAKDLTPVESAWLQQWVSRDNRKYGWDMDEIVRLIIVRRAVQAGFYNNGGTVTQVVFDNEYLRTGELDPYWESSRA